jgi:FixJ family two-component response regulator
MDASPYVAVVDDERSVALAVGRLICSAGFSVKTFTSGADLLQSLEQRHPDCIVADLYMPDLSGMLLQQLLAATAPGLPVIIMSGQDSVDSRTKAIAAGAHGYLVKPVDEGQLLRAIEAALASASTAVIIPWEPSPKARGGRLPAGAS